MPDSSDPVRVVMVTGAASGIGAATARRARAAGCRVILADIDGPGAEAVAAELGPGAMALPLDIRSGGQWAAALDRIWEEHGRLDVLVSNAAIVRTGRARDLPLAAHRETVEVNFLGAVTGMLAVLPRFRAQGSGHLVTVASMTAFLPFPGLASYAAAKHALRAFHAALAVEERDGPLAFTLIYPTATETPMLEAEARDDALALAFAGEPVTAERVAEEIVAAFTTRPAEVFVPEGRGEVVKRLGTDPAALRAYVEANEAAGRAKQRARRGRG